MTKAEQDSLIRFGVGLGIEVRPVEVFGARGVSFPISGSCLHFQCAYTNEALSMMMQAVGYTRRRGPSGSGPLDSEENG